MFEITSVSNLAQPLPQDQSCLFCDKSKRTDSSEDLYRTYKSFKISCKTTKINDNFPSITFLSFIAELFFRLRLMESELQNRIHCYSDIYTYICTWFVFFHPASIFFSSLPRSAGWKLSQFLEIKFETVEKLITE